MDASTGLSLAIQLITKGLEISNMIQQSHAEGRGGDLTDEQEAQVRDSLDVAIAKLEQS